MGQLAIHQMVNMASATMASACPPLRYWQSVAAVTAWLRVMKSAMTSLLVARANAGAPALPNLFSLSLASSTARRHALSLGTQHLLICACTGSRLALCAREANAVIKTAYIARPSTRAVPQRAVSARTGIASMRGARYGLAASFKARASPRGLPLRRRSIGHSYV